MLYQNTYKDSVSLSSRALSIRKSVMNEFVFVLSFYETVVTAASISDLSEEMSEDIEIEMWGQFWAFPPWYRHRLTSSSLQILPRKTQSSRGRGRAPRPREQLLADQVQREWEQGGHLDEEVRGAGNGGGESRRAAEAFQQST